MEREPIVSNGVLSQIQVIRKPHNRQLTHSVLDEFARDIFCSARNAPREYQMFVGTTVTYGRKRYGNLVTFRDFVKAKWLEWNGKVKEMQIRDKEKELTYYKKKVVKTEKEIEELKML